MQNKKNIFTNPCSEKWADMTGEERKRLCAKCKEHVHDVSHLSLSSVADAFIDSGKCVKMNADQIQFFQFLRSIPKVAGLSAALALYPFADTYAQDSIPENQMCVVYGKVHSNQISNRRIYVIVDGKTYETSSDEHGSFKIEVPIGKKIEDSNIRQLDRKKLKEPLTFLHKAKMPDLELKFTRIGCPAF